MVQGYVGSSESLRVVELWRHPTLLVSLLYNPQQQGHKQQQQQLRVRIQMTESLRTCFLGTRLHLHIRAWASCWYRTGRLEKMTKQLQPGFLAFAHQSGLFAYYLKVMLEELATWLFPNQKVVIATGSLCYEQWIWLSRVPPLVFRPQQSGHIHYLLFVRS